MTTFNGLNGQSIFDVCLNTYGSLDFLYKLLIDSGVENIDQPVETNQKFIWDDSQVFDNSIFKTTTLSGVIFATAAGPNGNIFYVTIDSNGGLSPVTGWTPPNNSNPENMQYETTGSSFYTATTDGEKIITLIDLIGWDILQIEKEIRPLKPADFNWNKVLGLLTLGDDFELAAGETLYILKKKMITT